MIKTNNRFWWTSSILFLTLLFACQKEIEYDGPGRDPRLVVNAIVKVDSTFTVYLERTSFFLSEEPIEARYISSGATITVTNNTTGQSFVMTQATSGNRYDFPFTTQALTNYSIEVSYPDYPTVYASMTSVPNVALQSVDTMQVVYDNQQMMQGTFNWSDPPGKNYYLIKIIEDYSDPFYSYSSPVSMLSLDPAIDNSENQDIFGEIYFTNRFLFTDETFDGQNKSLIVKFFRSFYQDPTVSFQQHFQLITLNEETYNYYKSTDKSLGSSFFSEPVKVFNNITNGFGIFGSQNYAVISM
jgi:hypothetical protein